MMITVVNSPEKPFIGIGVAMMMKDVLRVIMD